MPTSLNNKKGQQIIQLKSELNYLKDKNGTFSRSCKSGLVRDNCRVASLGEISQLYVHLQLIRVQKGEKHLEMSVNVTRIQALLCELACSLSLTENYITLSTRAFLVQTTTVFMLLPSAFGSIAIETPKMCFYTLLYQLQTHPSSTRSHKAHI